MLRAYTAACVHMRFLASFYHKHVQDHRYVLNEHPKYASSWQLPCMKNFERMPNVGLRHPTGPTPDGK